MKILSGHEDIGAVSGLVLFFAMLHAGEIRVLLRVPNCQVRPLWRPSAYALVEAYEGNQRARGIWLGFTISLQSAELRISQWL